MKIKVKDLIGHSLDWAVAKCEGRSIKEDPMGFKKEDPACKEAGFWIWENSPYCAEIIGVSYSPSSNWSRGGPIIERECLSVDWIGAETYLWNCGWFSGETPLIAAMRCFVASKLGDEIEIPEELITKGKQK